MIFSLGQTNMCFRQLEELTNLSKHNPLKFVLYILDFCGTNFLRFKSVFFCVWAAKNGRAMVYPKLESSESSFSYINSMALDGSIT